MIMAPSQTIFILAVLGLLLCRNASASVSSFDDCTNSDASSKAWPIQMAGTCRMSSEPDVAQAKLNLALMYADAQGATQKQCECRVEAIKLYLLDAEQGNAGAQYNLGLMYATGQGVPQNYPEAVKWYRLAADQGHAAAQHDLGLMYAAGQGVAQDYVQAQMWLSLAATHENEGSTKERDHLASLMTAAQIKDAQRLAREWLGKHRQ